MRTSSSNASPTVIVRSYPQRIRRGGSQGPVRGSVARECRLIRVIALRVIRGIAPRAWRCRTHGRYYCHHARRRRIYTSVSCPYCVQAKRLLDRKGVQYEEIDVTGDVARRTR